jgi:hypothetical protein
VRTHDGLLRENSMAPAICTTTRAGHPHLPVSLWLNSGVPATDNSR